MTAHAADCCHFQAHDFLCRLYSAGLCSLEALQDFLSEYPNCEVLQKDLDNEEYFCSVLMFVVNHTERYEQLLNDKEVESPKPS